VLRRHLLLAFLAVIVPSTLLLGSVTAYSLVSLGRVSQELAEIMHAREAVMDITVTLAQVGGPLGAYLVGGEERNRQRFDGLVGSVEAKLDSCGSSACHGSNRAPARMVEGLRPIVDQLKADGRRVFDEGPGGGAARVDAVRQSVVTIRQTAEPMLASVRRRSDALIAEAARVPRRAWVLTLSFTLIIALAGGLAAVIMARRISRPLSDLVYGIRRVMAGDWSHRVHGAGPGEVGEVARAFNRMVAELRQHRETLEQQNRTLGQRVRERTEELRQKEQELVQSERLGSLGLLAAGVAHELNNPLTSIVMNTNLLMEEAGEGTALLRDLQRIDADAARCRRIIEDLRAFARLRQIERVPGQVEAVLQQSLALAAHELDRRQVEVHCEVEPDLPRIFWDPNRMVQVVSNLLVNAAQAVERGGHVTVRVSRDDGWLRLEVEDDGPGIPAEHRTRIFDPFFTTKPEGTGLGLSISYGLVNEHGGRIEVESRTGAEAAPDGTTGTTVCVIVPVAGGAA
jgi:two-component system NtrC family sensor kinase